MRSALFFAILFCLELPLQAQLPPLIPYCKHERWGACDSTKKLIVPAVYKSVNFLSRHLLLAFGYHDDPAFAYTLYGSDGKSLGSFLEVRRSRQDGFIYAYVGGVSSAMGTPILGAILYDSVGHEVVPRGAYSTIEEFSGEMAIVMQDKKYGFINRKGKLIVPAIYDEVKPFVNGYAWVANGQGKSRRLGYIDHDGKETWVKLPEVETAGFAGDYISIYSHGKNGIINRHGKEVVPLIYSWIETLPDGFFSISPDGDKKQWSLWKDGRRLTPDKYEHIYAKPGGVFEVKLNDLYGYIDSTGREIVPPVYNVAGEPSDGCILVAHKAKMGFFDLSGNVIAPLQYDYVEGFHYGLAAVKLGGKWGVITKKGKLLTGFRYDEIGPFNYVSDTVACVRIGKYWGLINAHGEELTNMYYSSCPWLQNGYIFASCREGWGVMDVNGKIILPYRYDRVYPLEGNYWHAEDGGETTIFDSTGAVIPMLKYLKARAVGKNQLMILYDKDKAIMVNAKGEQVRAGFEKIEGGRLNEENLIVTNKGRYGVINAQGKELVPLTYKHIERNYSLKPREVTRYKDLLFYAVNENGLGGWLDVYGTFYAEK